MTSLKMLPVGIENFKEIRRDGFYYVDKTPLIKELLESRGKANLFTRPLWKIAYYEYVSKFF